MKQKASPDAKSAPPVVEETYYYIAIDNNLYVGSPMLSPKDAIDSLEEASGEREFAMILRIPQERLMKNVVQTFPLTEVK